MKIRLVALEGCSKCRKIKTLLDQSNINYDCVYCENNSNLCDYLEDTINTTSYPIINFMDNDEITTILYIGESYEELNKEKELNGGIVGIPMYSIDNMVQYIKNKLY
jgi:hypothetical protein